jgi:hypothetical protein
MATANRVHSTPPSDSSIDRESIVKNFDSRIQVGAVNRRYMLMNMIVRTAAMTATAGAMNTAATFAEPDPIYAAIEACRAAKHALDAVEDGAHAESLALALLDLYEEFAETVPATREGLFAKLVFGGAVADRSPDAFDSETMLSTLTTAADMLMAA